MNTPEDFMRDALIELNHARKKFPSANHSFLALTEEVGELAQAILKVRAGKWDKLRIYQEAIQVATMAMRVALENDESLKVDYREP